MTITALPAAPSRSDAPETFVAKADAFVAALAVMVTEMNAAISTVNMTKWISGTTYAVGDVTWSPADFQAYRRKVAGAGTTDPSADTTNWQRTEFSATSAQAQSATAFTTGGSSTAFTLTPTPAITANTTGQRFRVAFHAASGATPTLAVSGQTAKNLKYKDPAGAKQAITATQVPINWRSDVEYDGTDWVVLQPVDVMTATVGGKVPTPPNTTTTFLRGDATFSTPITLGTPVASTSGTSVNFTGIPPGTKRVTVMFDGVSTGGTALPTMQIGDSGGLEATGYISSCLQGATDLVTSTTNFPLMSYRDSAAEAYSGVITLTLMNSSLNTWALHSQIVTAGGRVGRSAGTKSLSGVLDRLTVVFGSDTFDAGSINIAYE